ncbi:unknown protein [Cronobacter turicensis z3032]|uniref:Uncharacterized protein n=1 Tax=Cronobacter turicensis (strain DSM 18703 / CCUG 55852 / LMG 23827 / z3032) TaxID=693216 RepID=C9Y4I5_CROTZ|nr:unknown protein [Cronobacter turicensis z3032]
MILYVPYTGFKCAYFQDKGEIAPGGFFFFYRLSTIISLI